MITREGVLYWLPIERMDMVMATPEQIKQYNEIYQAAYELGDPHPSVVAAQWAVETGWGKKPSGVNNMFGIKAGNGDPSNEHPGTTIMTTEVVNGRRVKVPQKFRDYESIYDSVADRVKFTQTNPRYARSGYDRSTSAYDAARALQRAGYATDPNYAATLTAVMRSAGHDPYDGMVYAGHEWGITPQYDDPYNQWNKA